MNVHTSWFFVHKLKKHVKYSEIIHLVFMKIIYEIYLNILHGISILSEPDQCFPFN